MNIIALEVKFNFNGIENTIYPVVLQNNTEVILVDCGYPGFMPLIENAAQQHNLSLQDFTSIIITHHDMDHVGGLFEIKEKYPSLKVYSSEIEAKYINGQAKSLRLVQAENIYASLPEDQKPGALSFQEMLKAIRPVAVNYTFTDAAESPFFKNIEIINTPGHMPGHISIYLKASKTLIAADALVYENNELEIANPSFTLDLKQAVDSIKKFQLLEIDRIICYHGGVVENGIQNRLKKLIIKYKENYNL